MPKKTWNRAYMAVDIIEKAPDDQLMMIAIAAISQIHDRGKTGEMLADMEVSFEEVYCHLQAELE